MHAAAISINALVYTHLLHVALGTVCELLLPALWLLAQLPGP
jgi:hypothetical protein